MLIEKISHHKKQVTDYTEKREEEGEKSCDLRLIWFSMPFFKRKDSEDGSNGAKTNGNGTNSASKEKVNFKARLEHKTYLVGFFHTFPFLNSPRLPKTSLVTKRDWLWQKEGKQRCHTKST